MTRPALEPLAYASLELLPLGVMVVDVSDNGAGMTPEVQQRLFTPMFTTKPGGTGLGLASAHAAIRRHGGTIAVTSRPGGGSRFRITLPAAPGAD